ncbi:Cobyrinic acid ac-diamide synthase [Desulfofarcimen acetoxidans DSM 771]|uniref:Sporulation initiation inhibitor protein Soj n=1 Tax=Desulfofarcimen acetoxidans (strain ATCC 49208 / DSM 771 / KCTC 5769 / VKM B-1644 / 5575) TaxID=485916 RepID=C8W057_DESAS|nr:AAA family ATPase [Desulfofarcimen acetoxidans]ACV65025.1 Cobyrinic acid ac-diamide synthase [Desulfofarcimen acetoxidans DSM 771]
MGRTIAIANQKGGVGKTTTAVNLSSWLSLIGKKVLLIDIDPQGNASSGVGIVKDNLDYCIYDVLINNKTVDDVKQKTIIDGLYILPSTVDLAGAEIEMVNKNSRENILKKAINQIKEKYDYIIIDCPPSLGLLTINSLTAADSLLITIQCEYYALEGLGQLMNTVKLVQQSLNPKLTLEGVLLTMFDGRTNLSIQVVDEVKKFFKNKVYKNIIPRNVRLSEAPSHGKPVMLYDPRSRGAEVYQELAKEVLGIE